MSITHTTDTVAVWVDPTGAPTRMFWAGRRYRVTDTPTRLGPGTDLLYASAMTHPPSPLTGWRFQGSSEDGDTLITGIDLPSSATVSVVSVAEGSSEGRTLSSTDAMSAPASVGE